MENTVKVSQQCPNCCSSGAIKDGNEVTCQNCDATFTIKRTGGAKIKRVGRLEDLEARVSDLETRTKPTAALPAEPAKPAEPAEPEEGILG